MISKKVCIVGAFSVGKTSLIKRYVASIFDEKYITTIGVKIDKKVIRVIDQEVCLVIWDIEGDDDFSELKSSYLRGASGYILVADGTRPNTLAVAEKLHAQAQALLGNVPAVFALNKKDLVEEWRIGDTELKSLQEWADVFETSAKDDLAVESLFVTLAEKMLR